jgi:SOS-response transcriptional repressor LexA
MGRALGKDDYGSIAAFIKEYWLKHNYSPDRREIKEALGISSLSVLTYRLNRMREIGMLRFDNGRARSYTLPTMNVRFEE